jgi:PAS domain-containing protein
MQDSVDIENHNTQFKSLIEDSPLAVYTTNEHGHLAFYNRAAVHILGRTPVLGEDVWHTFLRVYHPDGRPM